MYEDGATEDFTFNGTVTANLSLKFEPELTFSEGGNYTVVLNLDPNLIFVSGGIILDPVNIIDWNDINIKIKVAFKATKK